MNMNYLGDISPSVLLKEVENFSNKIFPDKHSLLLVFTEGLKEENKETFEKLLFTSKYVLGLKRVLEKGAGNPDINNLEEVKKDLSENLTTVMDTLKNFNSVMPEINKENFRENYLNMTPECLINLYKLLEGLEWTKMYLNDLKRK